MLSFLIVSTVRIILCLSCSQQCRAASLFCLFLFSLFSVCFQYSDFNGCSDGGPKDCLCTLQYLVCKTLARTPDSDSCDNFCMLFLYLTHKQELPTTECWLVVSLCGCGLIPSLICLLSDHSLSLSLFPHTEHRVFSISSKRLFYFSDSTHRTNSKAVKQEILLLKTYWADKHKVSTENYCFRLYVSGTEIQLFPSSTGITPISHRIKNYSQVSLAHDHAAQREAALRSITQHCHCHVQRAHLSFLGLRAK